MNPFGAEIGEIKSTVIPPRSTEPLPPIPFTGFRCSLCGRETSPTERPCTHLIIDGKEIVLP